MRDALVASVPGQVDATAKIASGGRLKSVDTKASSKLLAYEVDFLLRHQTQYSPACEGKTVQFFFTYILEGEATDVLQWRVLFRPPNHFTIVSRPLKPIVEYRPR